MVAAKGSSCLPSEKSSTYNLKTAKRSKSQKEETECTNSTDVEKVKEEEVDLSDIKCEDCSDNSYSAFDLECGLHNDLGVYLKKPEKKEGDSTTNLRSDEDLTSSIASEEKQNGSKKMSFYSGELQNNTLLAEQQNSKASELGTILKENLLSSNKGDQTTKANISTNHISEATSVLERNKDLMVDKQKAPKAKIKRSAALSKATKNIKKSYVPIQPKPADALKLSVRFERNQIPSFDNKKESEGISLCEESDSQEPEEEIVRYFKHLDENDLNTNGLVDQAVKNIDSNTVQISSISQIVTNSRNSTTYAGSEEVLNQANQQILRSQSCFEEHRGVFNLDDKKELVYMPRSQSSVELPTSNDQAQQEATDSDSGLDGRKKKISHLKILLEKSISSDTKNPYSTLKNRSNMSSVNPVMPNAQNPITEPVSQVVSNESNFLLSNIKPVDRDLLKLNGLKVLSKGPSFVPQSPNTRTKYFSFTPISPGPQSPLKTLSASPFVSPRSTPVSRSKPNSHTDHFLSPSERKTGSIRQEGVIPKNEFLNENVYNFFKNLIENSNGKSPKPSTFAQGSRPRSYSSTNFYRSKARRNSSKPSGFDRNVNAMPKNHVTPLAQTNYPLNSHFSSQPVAPNFVSCESLSNEVQKFLENNSKLAEGQAATIRSRSAPLNKMISESNWISNQISPLYSGYFNSGNSGEPGKLSNLVSNSHPNSPKDVTPNMSAFVTNGEIANLGSAPLAGEIFSGDPGIPQLNEQYFSGDFQRPNDENFAEGQPFSEDSAFSNKLDLNSSGTFDGAFASDSDPAIADNIKSYLPDFESLDNKSLAEAAGSGESVVQTDRKLFKNTLYEGGNDNLKDPVITSFKPVLMNEISSSPGSPVLNFFGPKMNEDSQQLIEFFNFED